MFTKSLIAAGLVGLVLSSQSAAAQSTAHDSAGSQARHRVVQFADLDLATPVGQSRLEGRLRRAASSVCESNAGPHPLSEAMEARSCYRTALESAHRTIAGMQASTGKVKMVSR
jgi:UrcA family protein